MGVAVLASVDESAASDLKVSIVGAIPAPDPRHMLDARRLPMLDRFSVLAVVAAQQRWHSYRHAVERQRSRKKLPYGLDI